jgi:predicted lactoylglutathione lyase
MVNAPEPSPFASTLSFLTLTVHDVQRAARFYEHLGWRRHPKSAPAYAFFQLNGLILALYGAKDLPKMWGGDPTGSGARIAMSHNVEHPDLIPTILERVRAAGGRVCAPIGPTPWGGVRWFEDLDGHRWELVHNPKLFRDRHGGAWLSGEPSE